MSITRYACAFMTASLIFLPPAGAVAATLKDANASAIQPITESYTKQDCIKNGGSIGRDNGHLVCLLPAAGAKTVVKSKSNITNN